MFESYWIPIYLLVGIGLCAGAEHESGRPLVVANPLGALAFVLFYPIFLIAVVATGRIERFKFRGKTLYERKP